MTAHWDPKLIADILARIFITDPSSQNVGIDLLITFDRHGVSSHPNHCSLYHGAKQFLVSLLEKGADQSRPVSLYTLTSTALVRKYTFILDLVTTMVLTIGFRDSRQNSPSSLLFVSSPAQVRTAQKAMTKAHQSQMRWFRWGWIGFSRYMIINDLDLEIIQGDVKP